MFIDTHCHLYPEYKFVTLDPDKIVLESIKNGVTDIWLASTEKADIEWNLNFCKKYPNNLKSWVGWHPEQYLSYNNNFLASILKKYSNQILDSSALPQNDNQKENTKNKILAAKNSFIVGIGEIGLDFAVHAKSTQKDQVKVFESQLILAQKYKMPVAIHCRDAFEETLNVLSKYKDLKILWHCFNLQKDQTKQLLKVLPQVYIALNSIFTYKSGAYIGESLELVDLSKIVLETDSPFLTPRPFKYSFNTPEGVIRVYLSLADKLNLKIEDLQKTVRINCNSLNN